MKKIALTFVFFLVVFNAFSQYYFIEALAIWDDRVDEWDMVVTNGAQDLDLRLVNVWPLQKGRSEWRIESDSLEGTIKTKWKGDFTHWELRMGEEIVDIRQSYRGSANSWVIYNSLSNVTLRRTSRNMQEWFVEKPSQSWSMGPNSDDLNEWWIDDYLEDRVSMEVRCALVFIVLWSSVIQY